LWQPGYKNTHPEKMSPSNVEQNQNVFESMGHPEIRT
jgi:hypothetical protein